MSKFVSKYNCLGIEGKVNIVQQDVPIEYDMSIEYEVPVEYNVPTNSAKDENGELSSLNMWEDHTYTITNDSSAIVGNKETSSEQAQYGKCNINKVSKHRKGPKVQFNEINMLEQLNEKTLNVLKSINSSLSNIDTNIKNISNDFSRLVSLFEKFNMK